MERIIRPRSRHPHVKPIGLIARLVGAVTKPGDLIIDPAAGSFVVMQAAHELGRKFIGCDFAYTRPGGHSQIRSACPARCWPCDGKPAAIARTSSARTARRIAGAGIVVRAQAGGSDRGDVMPTSRPDLDNYVKSALDALNTIVVVDDSQIVEMRVRKKYGGQPKLVATIYPLDAAASQGGAR